MEQKEQRRWQQKKGQKGYHKLLAWQRAHELVLIVYELSKSFPREETYGLRKQWRDAAVSVPANIAEGYGRNSDRQYLYHLNVAWGSLAEVEYYAELALDLEYITDQQYTQVEALRSETAYLLYKLIQSIAERTGKQPEGKATPRTSPSSVRESGVVYNVERGFDLTMLDFIYPSLQAPSAPFGPSAPSVPFDPTGSLGYE